MISRRARLYFGAARQYILARHDIIIIIIIIIIIGAPRLYIGAPRQ